MRRILLSHNSLDTQHCSRLTEKTNVHHAGQLNKKNTHTEKEIIYEHKTTKKERKDSEITQYEKEKVPKKSYKIYYLHQTFEIRRTITLFKVTHTKVSTC